MFLFKWLVNILSTAGGIFAGLWIGGQFREQMTGQPVSIWQHTYTTEKGTTMRNFPVITKFWPAFFFSMLGKPHWLSGLIGGVVAGLMIDDSYEDFVLEKMAKRMNF